MVYPPLKMGFGTFPVGLAVALYVTSSSCVVSRRKEQGQHSVIVPLSSTCTSGKADDSLDGLTGLPKLQAVSVFPSSALQGSVG